MQEELGVCTTDTPPVNPGRLPPMRCPHCAVCMVPEIGPGAGNHVARLLCGNRACRRFLQWAPRRLVHDVSHDKVVAMVASINHCILLGTIGRYGVTVTYQPNGNPCASFVLVLSEQGRDGKDHYTYIDCAIYGGKAESAGELEAGQLALFEGKLAKRKKGDQWETLVVGYTLTPVAPPVASMTGSSN